MRIVVCVKVVPAARHTRRIDPSTGRLVRDAGAVSDLDRRAIEEALRIRDAAPGSEVVAVSMAPGSATGAVVDMLAMGADRAVHVADRALQGSDVLSTSRVLARSVERESPDLVVFGPQGEDSTGALLWAAVAARLRLPVLSQADEVSVVDGRASVVRQTEAGYETLEASLPCVIGVTGSINQPRYASVKGKLAARSKPNEMVTADDLGLERELVGDSGSGTSVRAVSTPPPRGEPMVIKAGPDVATEIYEYLRTKLVLS